MCGTSKDYAHVCRWMTPAIMCLLVGAMGFSMVSSCFYGWYYTNKVEWKFIPWTCRAEGDDWIEVSPEEFPDEDSIMIRDHDYLRQLTFMTKNGNYNATNLYYECWLYGWDPFNFTAEDDRTIVWDTVKMRKFFKPLVLWGIFFGLLGMFSFLIFWRKDTEGQIMHVKLKQIFFVLMFAIGMFIGGICGLVIDLYPYNGFGKSLGGVLLGISLLCLLFFFWNTFQILRKGLRRPSHGVNQGGQVYHLLPAENEMGNSPA